MKIRGTASLTNAQVAAGEIFVACADFIEQFEVSEDPRYLDENAEMGDPARPQYKTPYVIVDVEEIVSRFCGVPAYFIAA